MLNLLTGTSSCALHADVDDVITGLTGHSFGPLQIGSSKVLRTMTQLRLEFALQHSQTAYVYAEEFNAKMGHVQPFCALQRKAESKKAHQRRELLKVM